MHLRDIGALPEHGSIIEIGAQQLADSFLADAEDLEKIRTSFRLDRPFQIAATPASQMPSGRLVPLRADAPRAAEFWHWLGYRYASIDIDSSPASIPLDLNYDRVPRRHVGKYSIVTNYGTTEHIANQLNAFRVIHDLTAPGGIMIHVVPAQGMFNHGLINYNLKFFWMLARSNGYGWLDMDFRPDPIPSPVSPDLVNEIARYHPDIIERSASYQAPDGAILVAMRKDFNIPFVAPLDVPSDVRTDIRALRKRYWTVFNPEAFAHAQIRDRTRKRIVGAVRRVIARRVRVL
ncbi:hypothetical protein [Acidocella sp.]|jgi:hypothetical protein|uniref:hypothetical protein n=1 Tax=Acidocella sp. TaxID=50710 RepID=UPI002F426577